MPSLDAADGMRRGESRPSLDMIGRATILSAMLENVRTDEVPGVVTSPDESQVRRIVEDFQKIR